MINDRQSHHVICENNSRLQAVPCSGAECVAIADNTQESADDRNKTTFDLQHTKANKVRNFCLTAGINKMQIRRLDEKC
jgi:hypothetical protein